MPKVLIFGAGGFVGPWLTREMASHGWEVVCSDRSSVSKVGLPVAYRQADLMDANSITDIVAELCPDAIVNLAAISSVGQSWKAPRLTIEVNILGSLSVLEAAKALGTCPKVLLVGSSEEYFPSEAALTENSPLAGNNPYGISKRAVGEFADLYESAGNVRLYRTRSFNHTGPGQASTFVVPNWCKQVANFERAGHGGIMRVGNLSVRRDISDVRDIVRGYRMFLESDFSGEVLNFGSGVATPLQDILELVIGFSKQNISYEVDQALIRPVDQLCVLSNISSAKTKLGWEPKIPLSQTLHDVYESFLRMQS
jgi:GDP-4-dehydro-6-deoxy-D-mannose reductase